MSGYMNKKSEPFKLEDQIPLGALNNLREGMPRQVRGGRGVSVNQMGDRLTVRDHGDSVVTPDIGIYSAPFVVRQELDDYLLCTPFTQPTEASGWWIPQGYDNTLGASATVFVYVAKPYLLQKSGWNGKTVSVGGEDFDIAFDGVTIGQRTVTDADNVVQTQNIATPYVTGDVIWACMGVTGLTAPSGAPIVWMDRNDAARQWLTTDIDTGGSNPTTVLGGNYAGAVGVNALLQMIQQYSGTRYQEWYRIAYGAGAHGIYLGGGDRRNGPATAIATPHSVIYFLPFLVPRTCRITKLIVYPQPGGTTGNVRLGVYSSSAPGAGGGGVPDSLLVDGGTVSCAGAIVGKIATVSLDLTANTLVWIAMLAENNGTGFGPTLMFRDIMELWPYGGFDDSGYAATDGPDEVVVGYFRSFAFGSLPASALASGNPIRQASVGDVVPWLGVGLANFG